MSRSGGLRVEERAVGPRHPHHVAEAGEDDVAVAGQGDAVVDTAHRDHADRTAGPVNELHVVREQLVDRVLVDRVGVAAADLHQLVVAVGRRRSRGSRPRARDRARDHGTRRRTSCDRRPRVDEQLVVDRHRAGQAQSQPCGARPPSSAQSASCLRLVDPQHPHRLGDIAAGDARTRNWRHLLGFACGGAPVHLVSFDRARSELLELRLVVGAHAPRASAASRSPPPRRPWRSRNRRGSGPSRRGRRRSRPRRAARY